MELGFTSNQSQESSIASEHATSSIVREDSMGTFVLLTGGEIFILQMKKTRGSNYGSHLWNRTKSLLEMGFDFTDKASLRCMLILLPQLPTCWDCKCPL